MQLRTLADAERYLEGFLNLERAVPFDYERLGLARAIGVAMELPAGRADVLLLDEPTSGLDEKSREMAEKVILNQAEIGTAVLMVTHDRAQAIRMGKRVIDIEKGKLVNAGSPNGELP